MRRIVPLVLVCVAVSSARADGFYFTEGFGGTKVKDELSAYMSDSVRIRLSLGMRRRNWAVEGWLAGAIGDYAYAQPGPSRSLPDGPAPGSYGVNGLTMWGLDLKMLQPLSPHLEVYLRGTASGASGDGDLVGYRGRGLGFGAGAQLKGKVPALGFLWWPLFFTNLGPKVTAAVFLDEGYEFYRLHGGHATAIDAQLTHVTLGFAVGSDF